MVQKSKPTLFSNCVSPPSDTSEQKPDLENPPKNPHLENRPEKPPQISEKCCLDDYEPYDYGKQQNPTIFWGPVFHLLKYIIGAGVLTLPYTFKSVGYAVAIFGALLVGVMYTHVLHVLLDVEYNLCKKLKVPSLTFVGIVEHTFRQGPRYVRKFVPAAKFLVYFHYVFNKSLMNAVYLITIASNFKIIIHHYCGTDVKLIVIMTALLVPLIGLALIRELKFLVPFSMLTNMFNMINLVLILFIPNNHDGSGDLKAVNDITQFPNFFAIFLGAIEVTGMSLPMKNDMKNPKRFTDLFGVLNIALTTATLIYCGFGILGYAKYGDSLKPNILFNLPPDHAASLVILTQQSIAICVSFILFVYIGFDTIWVNLFADKKIKHARALQYAIRIFLCVLPYGIAVALPDFKIMISLTNVIGILMDQAVPPILHIILLVKQKPKNTRYYLTLMKDVVIILICFCLFIAALVDVIGSIVKFYV